ncbi:MAG: ATP:cob(I)alamin adenosyltransferase [Candidatus Fischerbacteria bacterium RBG_13_37_8]|uniref:Corrinoid adenosyltransferase n=1 Tax=Candidatus Fischerbacteria bacterium RBG_13_37_8 TaxID=1817863 RepID=A0A1F5V678_9BACT|nr:MAG: ATP:cob(I)alamin adenosyltransferase [Candidatus Fischerbacteria bacterium RBG_13_37_8]
MNNKRPRIDKVVTKTGDEGFTHIIGGARKSKASEQVEAYGNVDEINSLLGIIIAQMVEKYQNEIELLKNIQNDLFVAGSDLASTQDLQVPRIKQQHIEKIEEAIKHYQIFLTPLQEFILPGGSQIGSMLHLARTIIRRTERSIVKFSKTESINPSLLIYFNRLSDLFFILARYINKIDNKTEDYCNFDKE